MPVALSGDAQGIRRFSGGARSLLPKAGFDKEASLAAFGISVSRLFRFRPAMPVSGQCGG